MKNGAADFICKPFEVEDLKSALRILTQDADYKKRIDRIEVRGKSKDAVEYFKSLMYGSQGLIITQSNPKVIKKKYDLEDVSMLWLSPDMPSESCIHPKKLSDLKFHMELFYRENPDGVALFDGIEALLEQHSWKVVKNFLSDLSTNAIMKPSRLIISAEEGQIEDDTLSELKRLISNPYVHIISESLSNPIRRNIVRFLSSRNSSSFTDILKELDIGDAPKLSFHLKKLVDHKILQKDDKIGYSLTERGKSTAECLLDLERSAMCDFQNNISLMLNTSKKKDTW
jgi:DNA-binding HxlR family transcriptional regulator